MLTHDSNCTKDPTTYGTWIWHLRIQRLLTVGYDTWRGNTGSYPTGKWHLDFSMSRASRESRCLKQQRNFSRNSLLNFSCDRQVKVKGYIYEWIGREKSIMVVRVEIIKFLLSYIYYHYHHHHYFFVRFKRWNSNYLIFFIIIIIIMILFLWELKWWNFYYILFFIIIMLLLNIIIILLLIRREW